MGPKSFLQLIGASNNQLNVLSAPSDGELFPETPVFTAPASAPLIPSPTKRGRTIDKSSRVAKRSRTAQPSQLSNFQVETQNSDIQSQHFENLGSDTAVLPDGESEEGPIASTSGFEEYVDAVLFESAGLVQISSDLCVAQGWDARVSETTNSWYHSQFAIVGSKVKVACQCPAKMCLHAQFLQSYYGTEFTPNLSLPPALETPVSFFYRWGLGNNCFKNIFSILASSSGSPLNRAIVTYEGLDTGIGLWSCSKDFKDKATCLHIKLAANELGLIGDQSGGSENPLALLSTPIRRLSEETAVSYLPILPPIWAIIPSDCQLYPRPPPALFKTPVPLFQLTSTSSCASCTGTSSKRAVLYNPALPATIRDGTLYTSYGLFPCSTELQACPKCPSLRKQFIGPDLREQGIFNYNNNTFVSHELLDEYTSSFTLSETPFDAWVEFMQRRYSVHGFDQFMGKDLFRSCWFAYARLQHFDNDFECPDCGKHPENVIWDGITLSFHRRQLLSSICPPTATSDLSVVRATQYICGQQFIPFPALRKSLRALSTGDDCSQSSKSNFGQVSAGTAQPDIVYDVALQLKSLSPELAFLFTAYYTPDDAKHKVPRAIQRFFFQVAAEESAIQMLNQPAQDALRQFVTNPCATNEQYLLGCPHIYNLINFDRKNTRGLYSQAVLAAVYWVLIRSATVLLQLKQNSPPIEDWATTADSSKAPSNSDWESTGCFYSMPQIRTRPIYPNLAGDSQKDGLRGGKCSKDSQTADSQCNKHFSTYGQKHLTGGIMVAWCTHSISYGFHCIPESEGRNDVFSAMITHWPQAPKRIVYDFSCALGPYCLLREPDFFAGTTFMIDKFHARDHTKCAPACFASLYAEFDPDVVDINTSAAECGNSVIARIRKSVSYMSQRRAITYMKVFLSIMNRSKIQGLLKSRRS